jgi:hypothetical protein
LVRCNRKASDEKEGTMANELRVGRANRWNGEVDDLLLSIKGVVFACAILEERGAAETELAEHRRELVRLRERLAWVVSSAGDGFDSAA